MKPGHRNEELSQLDRAAVLVYERSVHRQVEDPDRLKAVYSARFKAENAQARVAAICETGKAMLKVDGCEANLISAESQYDIAAGIDNPREPSFCKYVVNEKAQFGVVNALTHSIVCTSSAVTEKGIRAYLGLPLLYGGFAVGAFCVFSYTPREWQPFEVQVLATLAETVVDTLHWDEGDSLTV